jgi:hypothetical protein
MMRQAFDTAMYYNCHDCGGGYYTIPITSFHLRQKISFVDEVKHLDQ